MAETCPIEPSCGTYLPGHCVHWIQGRKSCELKQPETYVSTIVVHDDGPVDIEGYNLKLTLWNHSPGLLRPALLRAAAGRRRLFPADVEPAAEGCAEGRP